ncbi:hypothetical protein I4U23_015755 [Adineta vaga]|nr:hypothetical protein I4U23_015755 [Adineta vaga]
MTFKNGFEADLPLAYDNRYSPIKYLHLEGKCQLKILSSILSYVPQLRYLSVNKLYADAQNQSKTSSVILNHLLHASIQHLSNLQTLHFSMDSDISDLYQWEPLILSHIPHLRITFKHERK